MVQRVPIRAACPPDNKNSMECGVVDQRGQAVRVAERAEIPDRSSVEGVLGRPLGAFSTVGRGQLGDLRDDSGHVNR